MSRIFVSYRRADTDADAGRLCADLAMQHGEDRLFKDLDNVPLGENVEEQVRAALADSTLLLVLIGPSWDPGRLQDQNDWVLLEVR